jgi:hypothetical protein
MRNINIEGVPKVPFEFAPPENMKHCLTMSEEEQEILGNATRNRERSHSLRDAAFAGRFCLHCMNHGASIWKPDGEDASFKDSHLFNVNLRTGKDGLPLPCPPGPNDAVTLVEDAWCGRYFLRWLNAGFKMDRKHPALVCSVEWTSWPPRQRYVCNVMHSKLPEDEYPCTS